MFVETLNTGLRWLHVRVEGEEIGSGSKPIGVGVPRPGLFSALCLQLYNLVLEGETEIRTCPVCGVGFVRQRGRAQAGQYRSSGVIYCSKKCANREAARNHRIRKRQENA